MYYINILFIITETTLGTKISEGEAIARVVSMATTTVEFDPAIEQFKHKIDLSPLKAGVYQLQVFIYT